LYLHRFAAIALGRSILEVVPRTKFQARTSIQPQTTVENRDKPEPSSMQWARIFSTHEKSGKVAARLFPSKTAWLRLWPRKRADPLEASST